MNIYVIKDRYSVKIETKDKRKIRSYDFGLMDKYMTCDFLINNFFNILYSYQQEGGQITFIDKTRGETEDE